MKNRKLSFQLNVIHLSHFILLLGAILVVNFLLLNGVISFYIKKQIQSNTLEVSALIYNKITEIEQASEFICQQIKDNNTTDLNPDLIKAIELNSIISDIELVNSNAENFELEGTSQWKIGLQNDSTLYGLFYRKINLDTILIIKLKNQWTDIILKNNIAGYQANVMIFNDDFNINYSSGKQLSSNRFVFKNDTILSQIDEHGSLIKNINLGESDDSYFAYIVFSPDINVYMSVYYPTKNRFLILGRYPAFILLIFIFIIILVSYMIIRINFKYTKPYSDIIQTLKNSKFIKININSKSNEPMLIKRSIELLQNQLEFYVKNLEKTSNVNLKIENDLKIAKKIQRNILPTDIPEITQHNAFEINAFSEAAFDIGGDLYDYYLLDKKHLLFVVGDISGKGIPAALFMIYTQTVLRSIAKPGMNVSEIIENLNNKLIEENISDLFVTMLLGILDLETGKLNYCNAAHNYPLLIRQEGNIEELEKTHGIPLGLYPNRKYEHTEIQLNKDDQLMIYTDGLTDSIDENGMNYTIDVLKYNLMGTWFLAPSDVIEKIKKSVINFRGNIDPVDDLTLLTLKFKHKVNT